MFSLSNTYAEARPARADPVSAGMACRPDPLGLGSFLRARVANIALTAQVQMAYACAMAAHERALRAAADVEKTWPQTPLRSLVADTYRGQADSAAQMARAILAGARERCGLAFARI